MRWLAQHLHKQEPVQGVLTIPDKCRLADAATDAEIPDLAQEAMPYEELDKLVNEQLLNQYIESRCRPLACAYACEE